MLKEELEYNEYIFSYCRALKSKRKSLEKPSTPGAKRAKVTQKHDYRISGTSLCDKSCSGLSRALEIKARYEIFHKGSPEITQEKLNSIRKELLAWLNEFKDPKNLKFMGLTKAQQNEYINRTMPGYIARYGKSSINNKHLLAEYKISKGDFNTPSFDRTIASALEAGPFREYILIEKEDLFNQVYKRDFRGKGIGKTGISLNSKEGTEPHKDYLRKFTAAYLIEKHNNLEKGYCAPQEAFYLNKSVIYNWSSHLEKPSYYINDDVDRPVFKSLPLFRGLNKYKPDPQWINNYDILDITDKNEFKKWLKDPKNKGTVYYTDAGFSQELKRNIV